MIGSRTFATKKQSVASKRVGAVQYLVNARQPTADGLIKMFGIKPAEAERMIREELHKRSLLI
jgi:hypothetical protein